MAKAKPKLKGLFDRTEATHEAPADNSDIDQGNIKPVGVGLTAGEIAAVEAIGEQNELTRNALLRYAVRHFIIAYRAGEINLTTEAPPPPRKKLVMPK
jgi:hypothetical protein